MLALTDNAVQAVKGIVSASDRTDETGGLRLVTEHGDQEMSFQLSVAAVPAEDDEVIEQEGARLFLDPEASSLLEDKLLDAAVDEDRVAFMLADR
jgi:Fe-S cluster assembly iron-binding protein IscA